ncbi:MAG: hypothetical protein U9Q06_02195 [Nanoarchaeota archaeon]|nr:hypothetical protein [Nanoarchaeota archaeon]
MRALGFILSLIVVVGGLFLASGVWTYYAGHEYWETDKAGVPTGFIHGAIAPIMIIGGIFTDYGIYEVNHTGWWYDLFFVIGFLFVWAGGSGGTRHVIKNYYDSNQKSGNKRLHSDDLKEINEMIKKHVSKKLVKKSKKETVPKKRFLKNLFKKKTVFKEEEIKKPIKVGKRKKT